MVRKLYENFHTFHFQKRIVSAETIRGNTVCTKIQIDKIRIELSTSTTMYYSLLFELSPIKLLPLLNENIFNQNKIVKHCTVCKKMCAVATTLRSLINDQNWQNFFVYYMKQNKN